MSGVVRAVADVQGEESVNEQQRAAVEAKGTVFVINRYRDPKQNLRTQLTKIILRAGLKP